MRESWRRSRRQSEKKQSSSSGHFSSSVQANPEERSGHRARNCCNCCVSCLCCISCLCCVCQKNQRLKAINPARNKRRPKEETPLSRVADCPAWSVQQSAKARKKLARETPKGAVNQAAFVLGGADVSGVWPPGDSLQSAVYSRALDEEQPGGEQAKRDLLRPVAVLLPQTVCGPEGEAATVQQVVAVVLHCGSVLVHKTEQKTDFANNKGAQKGAHSCRSLSFFGPLRLKLRKLKPPFSLPSRRGSGLARRAVDSAHLIGCVETLSSKSELDTLAHTCSHLHTLCTDSGRLFQATQRGQSFLRDTSEQQGAAAREDRPTQTSLTNEMGRQKQLARCHCCMPAATCHCDWLFHCALSEHSVLTVSSVMPTGELSWAAHFTRAELPERKFQKALGTVNCANCAILSRPKFAPSARLQFALSWSSLLRFWRRVCGRLSFHSRDPISVSLSASAFAFACDFLF